MATQPSMVRNHHVPSCLFNFSFLKFQKRIKCSWPVDLNVGSDFGYFVVDQRPIKPRSQQVVTHRPAMNISIPLHSLSDRSGRRTSNDPSKDE